MAFAQQLDPALIAQLIAGNQMPGWTVGKYGNAQFANGESGDGLAMSTPNAGEVSAFTYKDPSREWYTTFSPDGKFLNEGDGRNRMSAKDLAMFAAAVYGAGSLGSMFGGPGWSSGGPLGFGGSAATPAASSSLAPGATFNAAVDSQLANAAMGVTGADAAAAATVPSWAQAGAAAPSWLADAGKSVAGGIGAIGSLGPVLGAVGGALTSKDQEQTANSTSTTTKDPYAPAKPFIDQQIAQGQSLANQYQANPFSAGQKQAYNNLTGLLGAINGNLGGLLGGMNAASSGTNNFDRSNPRKALTGSSINMSGWTPGLLNLFGG